MPIEDALAIDGLCVRFEQAWESGNRSSIEGLLETSPPELRSQLVRELLAAERDLRRRDGLPPLSLEACLARFPGFARDVRHAMDDTRGDDDDNTIRLPGKTTSAGSLPRPFGSYELLEQVASGGMGVVYRARQVGLDRIVAIKMIRSGQLASPEEIQRFQGEASAAARLQHPHIVPIHDIGEQDGQSYFSMDFIDGPNLAKCVADQPFQPRPAARLVMTVAGAVAYAHEQGILHRDLTPSNVLLDSAGRPWVTDFGLARHLDRDRDSDLTRTGQVIGTPSYMSPEQARGKSTEVGVAADVYSLGAILYFLLTGRPPFRAASAYETIQQVLESELVPPRRLNSAIDRDLDTICRKCLEKSPQARYRSVCAFADDLQRYLNREPIRARPVGPIVRTAQWCRRKPLVATLMAVSAVAGLGLVGLQVSLTVTQGIAATHKYYSFLGNARAEADGGSIGWTERTQPYLRVAAESRPASSDPSEMRSLAMRAQSAWDIRLVGELRAPADVGAMAFSVDSQRLAVAELLNDERLTICIYDPATCSEIKRYGVDVVADREDYGRRGFDRKTPAIHSLAFSKDGKWLAAGTRHGKIYCWDTQDSATEPYDRWEAHDGDVSYLEFASDDAILYSSQTAGGPIGRRDVGNRQSIAQIPGKHSHFALSPDGKTIICGNGKLETVQIPTLEHTENSPLNVDQVAFSRRGDWIAAGSGSAGNGESLHIIELATRKVTRRIGDASTLDNSIDDYLCLAADDRLLIGACSDDSVRIWDVLSGSMAARVLEPGRGCPIFAVDPAGRYLAVAGNSSAVLYQVVHPVAYHLCALSANRVEAIAFVPKSHLLATVSEKVDTGEIRTSALQLQDVDSDRVLQSTQFSHHHVPPSRLLDPLDCNIAIHPDCDEFVWGSSSACVRWRRVDQLPQPAYSLETGLQGALVLEVDAFELDPSGHSEIKADLQGANGKTLRMAPGDEVRFHLNKGDLDALSPAVICYAAIRVEGECTAVTAIDYRLYVDDEPHPQKKIRGVNVSSAHHHLVRLLYSDWPIDGQSPRLDVHMTAKSDSGLIAVNVDRLYFVPITVPMRNGTDHVFPKLDDMGPYSYSPDGRRLWGIEGETRIRCWSIPSANPALEILNPLTGLDHGNDILRAIVCTDDIVVVGARHGELLFFSAHDGSLQNSVLLPKSAIQTAAMDPSGQIVVAGSDQGGLWVVGVPGGETLAELPSHGQSVRSVVFSRDGKLLVSGSQDRSVRIWGRRGNSFEELFRLEKLPGPVKSVRLSDDKRRLAVLLEGERGVRVWKLDELNERFRSLNAAVAEIE